MKKNSEVRIQESESISRGFRPRTPVHASRYPTGTLRANKSGIARPQRWLLYAGKPVHRTGSRPIPEGYTIKAATVRKRQDGWYVSIRIEDKSIPDIINRPLTEVNKIIGCDLGLTKL